MKYFIKLNLVSISFAIFAFLMTAAALNTNRIQQLTGLSFESLEIFTIIFFILDFMVCYYLCSKLGERLFEKKTSSYWVTVMWFPYWIALLILFAYFFPNHNPGDDDNYGAAFMIFGFIMVYPIFIAYLTWVVINEKLKKPTQS